jgi:hypothetical protein
MMDTVFERPALADVRRLVESAGLCADDLAELDLSHFLGFGSSGGLSGVVGLEVFGKVALLRSRPHCPSVCPDQTPMSRVTR